MARAGDVLESPTSGERVVFRRVAADTAGELLEIEFALQPGGGVLAGHVHPVQEESFEIVSGAFLLRAGGWHRTLRAGETDVVPPGVPHDFRNAGATESRAIVRWRPALDTEGLLELLFELACEGRTLLGAPSPPALAARMVEHPDELYFARLPVLLQKGLARVLAPLGRARGH